MHDFDVDTIYGAAKGDGETDDPNATRGTVEKQVNSPEELVVEKSVINEEPRIKNNNLTCLLRCVSRLSSSSSIDHIHASGSSMSSIFE